MKPEQGSRLQVRRRDATGHINPSYARALLALSGRSDGDERGRAFLEGAYAAEELSEGLGEAFVESATSGEEAMPDRLDRVSAFEVGGPFVLSPIRREFATGVDGSNPHGSLREPFPRAVGGDGL
jgi:hypothetical protein